MATRRDLLRGVGATALAGGSAGSGPGFWARAAQADHQADPAAVSEDGLYQEPWFLQSFLELADDLDQAGRNGKRFAVMWELKGCPYCRETHLVNFARRDIADFVRSNFEVLQLNIIGSRKVTDFDGGEIGEKQLATKYGVRFTPTIQFFPASAAGLKDKDAATREVARIAGYLRPDDFLAMFRYVRENAYETRSFRDFLRSTRG
ncbi:MAG TPA: thioredoxin family protein [Xanthobacteraceae bacterium]|nr:thioredoxin family protein [Xanthobacteraceae bacterium]